MTNVPYPATIYNQEPVIGVETDFAITETAKIRLTPQEAEDQMHRLALALKRVHGEQKVLQIIGQLAATVQA